jgi:hypothetical protein
MNLLDDSPSAYVSLYGRMEGTRAAHTACDERTARGKARETKSCPNYVTITPEDGPRDVSDDDDHQRK